MVSSPKGKVSMTYTAEWLAASLSVPVVRAIRHPAGLSFGATEVVSKVIGFLALQKHTSPPVCVWPRGMEKHEERKSRTMWDFHSFTSKSFFYGFFLSFLSITPPPPHWHSLLYGLQIEAQERNRCCCDHVLLGVVLIYFICAWAHHWRTS